MSQMNRRARIAGLILHVLVGGLMILTGSQKILGMVSPEALHKYGLAEQMRLIGAGAIVTGVLLLVPRTSSAGILFASAFWGGALCIHMAHAEPYGLQAVMLVVSWVGAYLRNPAMLSNVSRSPAKMPEAAAASEPAVS
jgi:hypothetical protein